MESHRRSRFVLHANVQLPSETRIRRDDAPRGLRTGPVHFRRGLCDDSVPLRQLSRSLWVSNI